MKMKKYIYPALLVFFATVFLVSAGFLAEYLIRSKQQQNQYDELADLVQQEQDAVAGTVPPQTDPESGVDLPAVLPAEYITITDPKTGEPLRILRKYAVIYQKNTDLVGWIRILGTKVNYPVLQSPEEESFYLTHDFYQKESRHGAIYVEESADVNGPSDNVVIYGHKMSDGSMFATLHKYSDVNFYQQNAYFTFDTLFEQHTYKIFAVFKTSAKAGEGFAYHTFLDGDEESFEAYVSKCKELSLYETYVTAEYGDKLLTLSTCDHSMDNGRYVVVAKRIS